MRAASHSSTWGSISRSKRSRSVLRNSWCSSLSITGERYHRLFSLSSHGSPLHCALVTDVLVGVQHDDGIRTLTLDSPDNRNALSARLLAQLEQALRDATSDPDVRAVVLTGTGTVFCSGADLSERGTAAPNRMPAILTRIVESPVPVIARVNGHARAGGIGLIAAADMAVARRQPRSPSPRSGSVWRPP